MRLRNIALTIFASCAFARVDFRQTHSNKEFIGSLRDGEYEIVHPFQIREKTDRIGIDTRNYFLRGAVHYEHVTIVIRSNTLGRVKIVAERNDHLVLNQTTFRKLDTNGEHVVGQQVEGCFYQGTVAGDADSFVAFSSCNGLRGVIAFSNGSTYGMYPLDGGDKGKRHPHVLYRAYWSAETKCGAVASPIATAAEALVSTHKHRRDMAKQKKHVELAVIGDYEYMLERASDEADAINYMLEAVNIADLMLSRDLSVRLSVVYVEVWVDVQRVDLLQDTAATLAGLVDYASGHLYTTPKDATVLFTGGRFANDEAATATHRSVCTAQAAGIVKAVDRFSSAWSAQLLSQSVGHVLGLEHDSAACACPHCVMGATLSLGGPFGFQFSKCSVARMHGVWQSARVDCLLNRPFQETTLKTCGNGIVEDAEECDCGTRETCADPCCDALTCTLKAHAQCAAHHSCCQRCKLLPSSHECRASRGSCDVAEFCDGVHGECPVDAHLVDGTACGREQGRCWRGNCSDTEAQCRALWGDGARVAADVCFDRNREGNEFANCGEQPCAPADAKCGVLHCQEGDLHSSGGRSATFAFSDPAGKNVQCKAVADAVGLVRDGSACGPGKVCVGHSCVEMVQVSAPVACPTNNVALACSGHGDCTTVGKCVCADGWDGEACDTRVPNRKKSATVAHSDDTISPLDLAPFAPLRTLNTFVLLLILLVVGVMLFCCLLCLLVCYRRRTTTDFGGASADEKSVEAVPESQRTIKFGSMPSYREDKRKRKSNKFIYGALNRISEADERDSASLRSRESALLAEGRPMPSSRSDVGVGRHDSNEHVYAASVIGIGREEREDYPIDFPSFPWRNGVPANEYAHEPHYGSPSHHHRLLIAENGRRNHSSNSSLTSPSGGPLRLNNMTHLLKRLQYSDDDGEGTMPEPPRVRYPVDEAAAAAAALLLDAELEHAASNTESSRAGESPSQAPPSLDGIQQHSSSNMRPGDANGVAFRNSPSLFSDPFRLELSTSMHT